METKDRIHLHLSRFSHANWFSFFLYLRRHLDTSINYKQSIFVPILTDKNMLYHSLKSITITNVFVYLFKMYLFKKSRAIERELYPSISSSSFALYISYTY